MVKVLGFGIVVSEFESTCAITFTFGQIALSFQLCSSRRIDLALTNPRRVMLPLKKQTNKQKCVVWYQAFLSNENNFLTDLFDPLKGSKLQLLPVILDPGLIVILFTQPLRLGRM